MKNLALVTCIVFIVITVMLIFTDIEYTRLTVVFISMIVSILAGVIYSKT